MNEIEENADGIRGRYGLRGEWDDVGADGRFRGERYGAGAAPLALFASYGPTMRLSIADQLELSAGENEWTLDVTTAVLELRGLPPGTWTVETRHAADGSPEKIWRRNASEVALTPGEQRTLEL